MICSLFPILILSYLVNSDCFCSHLIPYGIALAYLHLSSGTLDVNIGCFDVADISAILTNFVSIISPSLSTDNVSSVRPFTMQSPSLHRHCPISTVLWDCPTTYHSFEITIQPCFLAVYACQMPLPAPSQDSLLSGWLNLG